MKHFTVFLAIICLSASGQDTLPKRIPTPKPDATIFFNFRSSLHQNEEEFEITRAYFGVSQQFDDNWSASIRLDIGSPDDISDFAQQRRYAYFRKADVTYKKGNFQFSTGIIDMLTYKESEGLWGKRYLFKSMQDEHKFGNSADLGFMLRYSFPDVAEFDLAYVNGKGYNKLQNDNTFKFCTGATLTFFNPFIVRIYNDIMDKDEIQSTTSILLGFDSKRIKAGTEYVVRRNDSYRKGFHKSGSSGFLTVNVYKKVNIFGRYDYIWSEQIDELETPWNLRYDGSSLIAGVEYVVNKNIRFSLNYQDWYPYAKNLEDRAFIYCNLEVKL